MNVEILYLAWNRLEFTRASFERLLANTAWELVDRLVVYDDVSEDGTTEYLREAVERAPVPVDLIVEANGGPVAVMADYLLGKETGWFAKIDNDIAVPAGWLERMTEVVAANPTLELLGMDAGMTVWPHQIPGGWEPGWTPCSHIGGVGLMDAAAFARRPRLAPAGRFGFTEWQAEHRPIRGWLTPDLPVLCLNLIPVEPWWSLTLEYRERGWQREWPGPYDPRYPFWEWFTDPTKEAE